MKETRIMHHLWKEMARLPKKVRDEFNEKLPPMLGKWYYYYENKNGKVGLARINHGLEFTLKNGRFLGHHYEACGHLDFQRFRTKKQAEIAIYKVLDEKYPK